MTMRALVLAGASCALLAVAGAGAMAQFGGGAKHAEIAVKAPAAVTAGKPFDIAVTVKVVPGFHIQANTVKDPWYATKVIVKGGSGLKAGQPVFPKSTKATVGTDTLDVFAGTVTIKVPVSVGSGAAGVQKLTVTLDSQACNDTSCFPPEQVTRDLTVTVKGRGK